MVRLVGITLGFHVIFWGWGWVGAWGPFIHWVESKQSAHGAEHLGIQMNLWLSW